MAERLNTAAVQEAMVSSEPRLTESRDQRKQSEPQEQRSGHDQTEAGTFTLLMFAAASTYTGTDTLQLKAPMALQQLFDTLEGRYSGIKKKVLRSAAVTVNLEYVEFEVDGEGNLVEGEGGAEVVIKAGDEVGIIPPVSSG